MQTAKSSLQCHSRLQRSMFTMSTHGSQLRHFSSPLHSSIYAKIQSTDSSILRRLSELEKETQALRQKLEQTHSTPVAWSTHMRTPSVSIESSVADSSPLMQNASVHHVSASPQIQLTIVSPPGEVADIPCGLPSPTGTVPRTIEGVAVSAAVIDELFEM